MFGEELNWILLTGNFQKLKLFPAQVDELRKTEDRKRRDPVYQRKKAAEPEAKAHHYGLNATHSRIFPVDNRAGWN